MEKERDRQRTEERLIDTIGVMIAESGFEHLGINQVAKRAGLSKSLIYRYFESLDGLIYAYIKKHDFWANARDEMPDVADMRLFLKGFYRRQIAGLRADVALRRLKRWELSTENDLVAKVRAEREKNGLRFTEMMCALVESGVGIDGGQVQAFGAIVDAAITHLALLADNCRMYNGIDIQNYRGWEQIADVVDMMVEVFFKQ